MVKPSTTPLHKHLRSKNEKLAEARSLERENSLYSATSEEEQKLLDLARERKQEVVYTHDVRRRGSAHTESARAEKYAKDSTFDFDPWLDLPYVGRVALNLPWPSWWCSGATLTINKKANYNIVCRDQFGSKKVLRPSGYGTILRRVKGPGWCWSVRFEGGLELLDPSEAARRLMVHAPPQEY